MTLLFVLFGAGYDFGGGWRWPTICFFGAADCSTAAATWTLCIVSGGTIVTGVSLYLIEVQPLAATLACPGSHGRPGEKRPRMIDAFVIRDLRRSENATVERFAPNVLYAAGLQQRQYKTYRVDLENLGRSAFVDLEVELRFTRTWRPEPRSVAVPLAIGALPADAVAHVVVHIDDTLSPRDVDLSGIAWEVGQRFTMRKRHPLRRFVVAS